MMPPASAPGLTAFEFKPRTRIVFGPNAVDRIGELAQELDAKRLLVVTDQGIVKAGHADRVERSLRQSGFLTTLYSDVEENPTTRCVQRCVELAREAGIDAIIGLGGGSSMDTAKGCNFILTNGGQMKDYWGIGKAKSPMLPLIAIPTTGGTGSECQSFALITDEVTHEKMACGDPKAAARIAILDPTLTLSQPARVTACTGIDALTHAVESAVTRKRNPVSSLYAREAFCLIIAGLPRVLRQPDDLEARGLMQLGAAWAGTAIENSMLGAAHSTANPLTAHFGIVHGQAVGMMLPHVIRFNGADPAARQIYKDLAAAAHLASDGADPAAVMAAQVEMLLEKAGLERSLARLGVEPTQVPTLARDASRQWTAQFNPVTPGIADFEALYRAALQLREIPGRFRQASL